ncbi:MAG: hypothetical protein WCP33_05890 [Deltaproteobacteria bacterium]
MIIRRGGAFRLHAIFLLFALLMAGCSANQAVKEERSLVDKATPKGQTSYHVWGSLLAYGAEQKEYPGYAVYTYVLFNANQSDATTSEGTRYDAILRAVLLDVKSPPVGTAAGWPKDKTNIFCIPLVTRYVDKNNALKKYDFDNAQKYLAALQSSVINNPDLLNRLKHRSGPFLISLCEPLPRLQGRAPTSLLYLDLTDMPAAGMREVLDSYRDRLDADPLKNVEKFRESLVIILLKYALKIDANLKIVNVAMAGFK